MGILSKPPVDPQEELMGILGNLQGQSGWNALTQLGAGLAGNASKGWGAGIGAGLEGAGGALQQGQQSRVGILGDLADRQFAQQGRDQQLASEQARLKQQMEIANRPEFTTIGEGEFGDKQMGFVNRGNQTVTLYGGAPGGGINPTGGMQDIVDGIKAGNLPPTLKGFYSRTPKIMAAMQKEGVDLTQMQLEHAAAQKQIASLNGPQMVRFAGLATSVVNTIDRVKELSKAMDQSGLTPFNKAKLALLVNTRGNTPQGQVAAQYLAAVNTLKEEFANLAQGGYAPTEAAWHLADQQINADYGVKQLGSALEEVQRLIRYRIQGIPNFDRLGPGAANRYVGDGAAPNQLHGGGQPPPAAAPMVPPPPAAPPQAGAQAPVRVNSPEEAMQLPPGTVFMTPDGRTKVRP